MDQRQGGRGPEPTVQKVFRSLPQEVALPGAKPSSEGNHRRGSAVSLRGLPVAGRRAYAAVRGGLGPHQRGLGDVLAHSAGTT